MSGHGQEGFVFTDGLELYKYIFNLSSRSAYSGHLQFLTGMASWPRKWHTAVTATPTKERGNAGAQVGSNQMPQSESATGGVATDPLYDIAACHILGPAAAVQYGKYEHGILLSSPAESGTLNRRSTLSRGFCRAMM